MLRKKTFKKIISFSLMFIFLASSLVCISLAWFSDKKDEDITINVAGISGTVTSSDIISPSDLIANNRFTKTLNLDIESEFSVYLRISVSSLMQTVSGDLTDKISLIAVSNCYKGSDDKYYYKANGNEATTVTGQIRLTLQCEFYVDSSVDESLFTDSNGNIVKTNKTTISYLVEYCQEAGFSSWDN